MTDMSTDTQGEDGRLGYADRAAGPSDPSRSTASRSADSIPDAGVQSRPSRYDEAIVLVAAKEVAQDCAKWTGEGEASDWVDDLVKCRWEWDDGYKLAKALESRCHCEADSQLVEVLDGAFWALGRAHTEAVKQWVASAAIKLAFAPGDTVETDRYGPGRIVSVEPETARYVVQTFDREWSGPSEGFVLEAERLSPAQAMSPGTAETGTGSGAKPGQRGARKGMRPTSPGEVQ